MSVGTVDFTSRGAYSIRQKADGTFTVEGPAEYMVAEDLETRKEAEEVLDEFIELEMEKAHDDEMLDKIEAMLGANPYADGRARVLGWLLLNQKEHFRSDVAAKMGAVACEILDTTHD